MSMLLVGHSTKGHSIHPLGRPSWVPLLALLAAMAGCKGDGEDARECNVDADCASHRCLASGQCEPVSHPADSGTGQDSSPPSDSSTDTGSQPGPDSSADAPADSNSTHDGGSGGCHPNYDGVIERAEVPMGPGFEAMFRISKDVSPFDSTPSCSGSSCSWDFVDVGGTTDEEKLTTDALTDQWFAHEPEFASATYASKMTEYKLASWGVTICDQIQYGVFQVTSDALLLLGVVSETEEEGTKLVYDPPVPIMRFPLRVGDNWTVETTAKGPLCNSIADYNISQTFTTTVDKEGTVKTPYGEFQHVLRINTLMERHIGLGVMPTSQRTHAFVAECHTTIANISSPEDVSDPEFDEALEVRRLSVLP